MDLLADCVRELDNRLLVSVRDIATNKNMGEVFLDYDHIFFKKHNKTEKKDEELIKKIREQNKLKGIKDRRPNWKILQEITLNQIKEHPELINLETRIFNSYPYAVQIISPVENGIALEKIKFHQEASETAKYLFGVSGQKIKISEEILEFLNQKRKFDIMYNHMLEISSYLQQVTSKRGLAKKIRRIDTDEEKDKKYVLGLKKQFTDVDWEHIFETKKDLLKLKNDLEQSIKEIHINNNLQFSELIGLEAIFDKKCSGFELKEFISEEDANSLPVCFLDIEIPQYKTNNEIAYVGLNFKEDDEFIREIHTTREFNLDNYKDARIIHHKSQKELITGLKNSISRVNPYHFTIFNSKFDLSKLKEILLTSTWNQNAEFRIAIRNNKPRQDVSFKFGERTKIDGMESIDLLAISKIFFDYLPNQKLETVIRFLYPEKKFKKSISYEQMAELDKIVTTGNNEDATAAAQEIISYLYEDVISNELIYEKTKINENLLMLSRIANAPLSEIVQSTKAINKFKGKKYFLKNGCIQYTDYMKKVRMDIEQEEKEEIKILKENLIYEAWLKYQLKKEKEKLNTSLQKHIEEAVQQPLKISKESPQENENIDKKTYKKNTFLTKLEGVLVKSVDFMYSLFSKYKTKGKKEAPEETPQKKIEKQEEPKTQKTSLENNKPDDKNAFLTKLEEMISGPLVIKKGYYKNLSKIVSKSLNIENPLKNEENLFFKTNQIFLPYGDYLRDILIGNHPELKEFFDYKYKFKLNPENSEYASNKLIQYGLSKYAIALAQDVLIEYSQYKDFDEKAKEKIIELEKIGLKKEAFARAFGILDTNILDQKQKQEIRLNHLKNEQIKELLGKHGLNVLLDLDETYNNSKKTTEQTIQQTIFEKEKIDEANIIQNKIQNNEEVINLFKEAVSFRYQAALHAIRLKADFNIHNPLEIEERMRLKIGQVMENLEGKMLCCSGNFIYSDKKLSNNSALMTLESLDVITTPSGVIYKYDNNYKNLRIKERPIFIKSIFEMNIQKKVMDALFEGKYFAAISALNDCAKQLANKEVNVSQLFKYNERLETYFIKETSGENSDENKTNNHVQKEEINKKNTEYNLFEDEDFEELKNKYIDGDDNLESNLAEFYSEKETLYRIDLPIPDNAGLDIKKGRYFKEEKLRGQTRKIYYITSEDIKTGKITIDYSYYYTKFFGNQTKKSCLNGTISKYLTNITQENVDLLIPVYLGTVTHEEISTIEQKLKEKIEIIRQ